MNVIFVIFECKHITNLYLDYSKSVVLKIFEVINCTFTHWNFKKWTDLKGVCLV